MNVPENLLYTKEHEWIKVVGKTALIGITDYAQHELGDIVYVELPGEEDEFEVGSVFGVIESVKAASDIYSPLTGTILKVNDELENNPSLINEDAYGSWIISIQIEDESQLEALLSATSYKQLLK